jgi:hypothetical protein
MKKPIELLGVMIVGGLQEICTPGQVYHYSGYVLNPVPFAD